jgi:TonB family protein
MIGRIHPHCIALLALCGGLMPFAQPAHAAEESVSLAAESCVAYQADGTSSYRLANRCDYAVEVAYCSQPQSDPGLCLRTQSWTRETLSAQSQSNGTVLPNQALDLFACRTPGKVEILPSGMARCSQAAAPVIPIMSAASLKNPAMIITSADYPTTTARLPDGTSRFEITVGPDGRPTNCTTTSSAGAFELDNAACKAFMRRARFSPAKDESGRPTIGRYKGSVTWKAP